MTETERATHTAKSSTTDKPSIQCADAVSIYVMNMPHYDPGICSRFLMRECGPMSEREKDEQV